MEGTYPVEEKDTGRQQDEFDLFQWSDECHELELASCGRNSRADSQEGNRKKTQDEECTNAHGPAKANLSNKMRDHDRKDDTTKGRSCRNHSECLPSLVEEPRRDR